jgi:hypothetical protein
MGLLLFLIAAALVIAGVYELVTGAILFGIILIVVGLVLGSWRGFGTYGNRGGPVV